MSGFDPIFAVDDGEGQGLILANFHGTGPYFLRRDVISAIRETQKSRPQNFSPIVVKSAEKVVAPMLFQLFQSRSWSQACGEGCIFPYI